MVDLIGDIHGHAGALRQLLGKLGYTPHAGVYRHPARQAVFLGDFIDRGPEIRETLAIVRRMIDSGAALGVMGNHELNLLRGGIYAATLWLVVASLITTAR